MKAWRVYGVGDIRLDDIPRPNVIPGWVVVKTRMVQLSVTEVQILEGTSLAGQKWAAKWKEGPLQMFGHEFCAEVLELGEGVQTLKVGDRVFWGRSIPCHQCDLCKAGYEALCRKGPILGLQIPACLAEYAVLPAECLVSVPASITDSEATAMQPFTGALRNVVVAEIALGDTVAVFGQGIMGLTCAQLSRACGASKVIGVDIRDELLALARQFGVDITINASKTDPVDEIMKATNGTGADIVFECAGGSPQVGLSGTKTLGQATSAVRDTGKVIPVSLLESESGAVLEYGPLIWRGIQYRGPRPCTQKEIRWAVDLVASRRVRVAPLVTHVLKGFDKIPEAIKITGNKQKYRAINPAQVVVCE
jgi:threonine dehydrogenase-like Zn-dependent dehydrogenase